MLARAGLAGPTLGSGVGRGNVLSGANRLRRDVDQPVEQLAVALDRDAVDESALDDDVVLRFGVTLVDDIRVRGRAGVRHAVDERRDLVAGEELEAPGR